MTHLPLHHNSVVFKLSEHVVNMDGFFWNFVCRLI
jgi:hypothetical protein